MTFKAVVFDMDGVIVDTEDFYYQRRCDFFDEEGIDIRSLDRRIFIGGNMANIWPEMEESLGIQFEREGMTRKYEAYKASHPLPYKECVMDFAAETLKYLSELPDVKVGLASNSVKPDVFRAIEETGFDKYFDVVITREAVKKGKPDPESYQLAMEKLNVLPQDTLVIEDSEKGIEAGVTAGCEVWAVKPKDFEIDQSQADRILSDLSEIQKLFQAQK